jgi:hypothetical protein
VPLIHYSQYIYLPGGNPAPNIDLPVYLAGGNVQVPLFANKAGTTPLANPVTTDADGFIEFYAAPGDYTVWLAGTVWDIVVDDDETDQAWPGTFVHEQSSPATVWTVGHHFGTIPTVSLVLSDTVAEAEVTHPDDETTVITFNVAQSGTAYLRR